MLVAKAALFSMHHECTESLKLHLLFHIASPQQGDLRPVGPPSGLDADSGARTHDSRVPADLRADSLITVPPVPPFKL
ncbi:hypothetical protein PoB_007547600 [Plakobranchus ocellatus]|uniref:Uncharacterized protein n=1 Tax=Plakobranchus ocellatus TaxID=259542 RepID=A0AAV4DYR7_9GAST|nr:hypothetical protein PoB_007547600 [Plakobranchus ocellatus]